MVIPPESYITDNILTEKFVKCYTFLQVYQFSTIILQNPQVL